VINEPDRMALLAIARSAVTAYVNGEPPPPAHTSGDLNRPAGAFVTIENHGELRGCIGHLDANRPLATVVAECAVAACSTDPRFPAVTPGELPHLDFEISVLGPLEPVHDVSDITVGRHGLVVEKGWHRGLLLPQVATEWKWDRQAFLEHTCQKAGLPRDGWKNGAKLWRFEAEVFGEHQGQEGQEGQERREGQDGQDRQEGQEAPPIR
jgi:AmmeMemoRadiSam system protein A